MKRTTIKTLATGLVLSVLVFTGCKKEAGPAGAAGAAGPAGANGVVPMSTDGFIMGNVVGTRKDGTPFNEAFNFQNYWGSPSGTLDSNSVSNYKFNLSRGLDIWGTNYANINISTTTKTATTGTITLSFTFTKSLGTLKQFEFMTYSSPTATVTGLNYNTSTGLYTGSFTMNVTGVNNSSGNIATISGSFQATITQNYHKQSHNTGINIKD